MADFFGDYPGMGGSSGSSYTFADSIVNNAGTVTLVNDSASPGNSKYYGTDSGGTLGYHALSAGGTVTSVALADSTGLFTISGSPVTTSGTLTLASLQNKSANTIFAGPASGSPAGPTFRAMVNGDLPAAAVFATSVSAPLVQVTSNGSVSAPSLNMFGSGDTNTGFYGSTSLRYSSAGTQCLNLNATEAGLPPFLYLNVAGSAGAANSICGNSTTDTMLIAGDEQGDTSQGGVLFLGSRASAVTQFWNAGVQSGSISASNAWTIGLNGTTNGVLKIANGGGSGAAVSIQNLGTTSAWNFNLPTTAGSSGQVLTSQGGTTNSMTWTTPAGGSVTSVAMTVPSFLSVSGSPVTSSGTLAVTLSGTALPIANGGTAGTSATAAFDNLSPLTTQGDVLYYNGTHNVRLGPGTNGQVLMTAGASANPSWQTVPGNTTILKAPTQQAFTATGTTVGYVFTVTSANATTAATYTNNGHTFTVINTIAAGTVLFCSGTSAPQASGTLTRSGGSGDATITFSAAQTYGTYTTPTSPSPAYLKVSLTAAGGAGGVGASTGSFVGGCGGAAGGTTIYYITSPAASYPYSIGTGGASSGAAGLASYFGANLLQANGGNGGNNGAGAGKTVGGTASGGTINLQGGDGGGGTVGVASTGPGGAGGTGGASFWGGGGAGSSGGGGTVGAGNVYGSGGGGGYGGAAPGSGGAGANGYLIVEEFYQ